MPRPVCITCAKPTGAKGYLEREKKCATCYRLSKLLPYDDLEAERLVQREFKASGKFDRVLAFVRRTMRPPPGRDDWMLHHVVELDSRRFTW